MFKKEKSILWALTDPGIILQKVSTNTFYELNEIEEKIWSYMDGSFTQEAILEQLKKDFKDVGDDELSKILHDTTEYLHTNGLISGLQHEKRK
jgi:hypothetical protein